MFPPPSAPTQQFSNPRLATPANGLQNLMQIQPQNQVPFSNPNHMNNVHGHPLPNAPPSMFQPGLMNVPNQFMHLHNNSLGMPQFGSIAHSAQLGPAHVGFASQNNGCNMSSVPGFPAQGPLNMVPNMNQMNPCLPLAQFFGQNVPNLVQQLNQSMGLPNGQFCLPYQNMNQQIPGQMLNMSQLPHPSSHGSYGGPNQAVPMVLQNHSANQHFGFNQGLHPVNHNPQNFVPQSTGANGSIQLPGSAQQLQGSTTMPFNSLAQPQQAGNLQLPTFTGSQGNSSLNDGGNRLNSCPKNLGHRNFMRNSEKGFQKNQLHHMNNEKKKHGFPGRQKGKGFQNERKNKFGVASCTNEVKHQKRPLLIYTEQEIKQWREARRKNYPSSANVQKKFTEKQTDRTLVDREAKLLRQELNEILAKQAELGVEVAEIPSEYLSYSDNHDKRKRHDKRDPLTREEAHDGSQHTEGPTTVNEKSRNKFNKKGKHDKKHRSRKKAKFEKHSSNTSSSNKREPTLLEKLLKTDMRRDKSHLLQALRFMAMNSFFKEWPNKPLIFPSVIIKENGCESNVVDEKSNNDMVEKLGHDDDNANDNGTHDNDNDGDNDDDDSKKNICKSKGDGILLPEEEEGEIID